MTDLVAAAREVMRSGDPEAALAALGQMDRTDEVLELRADAAYRSGLLERALGEREALYSMQLEEGRVADAALTAVAIALMLLVDTGLMSAVRGWSSKAEGLLTDEPSAADALLAAVRTYERFLCGDVDGAEVHARRAMELGSSLDVPLAVAMGRIAGARILMVRGRVAEGVELLDEVAVELMGDGQDPFVVGNMYCELICAAQSLQLLDRAREWTDVMQRWGHDAAFGAIQGRCRVHRAELLRVSGPAPDAEEAAVAACEELRPWMRRELGWPLVELGNIRLRRGDLLGAEEAFLIAHGLAWSPQPGLALLRLAQGDPATAADMVAGEISSPMRLPWKERPPIADLQLVPLLAALSEIVYVVGDGDASASVSDRLDELAVRHATPGIRAEADLARARAAVLAGLPDDAAAAAAAAVAAWVELGAPFDAASARVVLGQAHQRAGRSGPARLEWVAASTAFSAYGAPLRLAEVEALLSGTEPSRAETAAALISVEDGWRLTLGEAEHRLPRLKGIDVLVRLLSSPGREFDVVDLAGAEVVESGLPAIDEVARDAYRRRLAEVDDDIAEAELHNDADRLALAERDREFLLAELARSVGFDGRVRSDHGTVERARTSVTRVLRYAIARIARDAPGLGEHLNRAVRTGTRCSYVPDPLNPLTWSVSA